MTSGRVRTARRRRVVLDQLDQVVAEHDAARRHAEVRADGERRLVAHRDPAASATSRDEVGEALQRRSRLRFRARVRCTSGLVAAKFVGAIASTYCRVDEREPLPVRRRKLRAARELGQILAARAGTLCFSNA